MLCRVYNRRLIGRARRGSTAPVGCDSGSGSRRNHPPGQTLSSRLRSEFSRLSREGERSKGLRGVNHTPDSGNAPGYNEISRRETYPAIGRMCLSIFCANHLLCPCCQRPRLAGLAAAADRVPEQPPKKMPQACFLEPFSIQRRQRWPSAGKRRQPKARYQNPWCFQA